MQTTNDEAVDIGGSEFEGLVDEVTSAFADALIDDEPEDEGVDGEADEEAPVDAEQPEQQQHEESEQDTDVLAIDDDVKVKLDDETELTGRELKDGWLRQSDYTRKTQQLAEERKALEQQTEEALQLREELQQWWTDRQSDPGMFAAEVVAASDNPTQVVAQAILKLNEEGLLSEEFASTFDLTPVKQVAKDAQSNDRIERLERQLQDQQTAAAAAQQQQQLVAEYERTWSEIATNEFPDLDQPAQDELAANVVGFMRERGLTDLRTGWAAYAYEHGKPESKTTPAPTPAKKPVKRSASVQAVTPRSAPSGRSGANNSDVFDPATEFEDAAKAALAEVNAKFGISA